VLENVVERGWRLEKVTNSSSAVSIFIITDISKIGPVVS
jgi:hypothetical protein